MKNIKKKLRLLREWLTKVLFGLTTYQIITDSGTFTVNGRRYKVVKNDHLNIYIRFKKVATFKNFKSIVEL